MKITTDFLPLGTVLYIKDKPYEVAIAQRAVFINGKYYDYGAIPFPDGMNKKLQGIYFNHDDIKKIEFMGYDDDENKELIETIKETALELDEHGNRLDGKPTANRSKNPLERLPKIKEDSFLYKLIMWYWKLKD